MIVSFKKNPISGGNPAIDKTKRNNVIFSINELDKAST